MAKIKGRDGRVHEVPDREVDRFRNGRDGSALTDEDYDEMVAREQADNDHLVPAEFRHLLES